MRLCQDAEFSEWPQGCNTSNNEPMEVEMNIFGWLTSAFESLNTNTYSSDSFSSIGNDFSEIGGSSHISDINPATGLPMIGGIGGIDAGGSPYGFDSHSFHDM